MTILVTGATGLVGTRLVPRLTAAGHGVRALVRTGKPAPDGVERVEGDLLEPASLAEAVTGVTAIVHLAAVLRTPDADLIRRSNLDATRNLIAATREHAPDARFLMASTGRVYGAGLHRPAREDDPANAVEPYPASKVRAERELRESGLTWGILRLAFVYGDGDGHLQAVPGVLTGWKWHPAQALSTIHHRDVAVAVLLGLTGAFDGHTVNITDDAPTTALEIANLVGSTYPSSVEPLVDPWLGRQDGGLARSLGFRPAVRSVHQAREEDAL